MSTMEKKKSFYESCDPDVRAATDRFMQHLKSGTFRSRHREIYKEDKTSEEIEQERIEGKSW